MKSSPVATAKDFFSCSGDGGGDGVKLWCCGGVALVEKARLRSGTEAVLAVGWKKREETEEAMIGLGEKRGVWFVERIVKNIEINVVFFI